MRSPLAKVAGAVALTACLTGVLTTASAATKPDVVDHAAKPQHGINVWIGYQCEPTSTWETWGRTIFSEIEALHANAVGLAFPFYTDSHTANTYYAKQACNTNFSTPTPSEVGELVDLVHADHMAVFLRPYLSGLNLAQENSKYWSGNIAPTNVTKWFANYLNTLKPYLSMAQAHGVEHFAISTELGSMASFRAWSSTITQAKRLYKRNLVFTPTWGNTPNKKIWPGTTAGIDMYPYLPKLAVSSTPAQIEGAWKGNLKTYKIPGKLSNWTDDETGIPAQDGAYATPNLTNLPPDKYPFNQTIQANWFTAACAFVNSEHMGGIYFSTALIYNGGLLTSPNSSEPFELQPQGLAAIKACFS